MTNAICTSPWATSLRLEFETLRREALDVASAIDRIAGRLHPAVDEFETATSGQEAWEDAADVIGLASLYEAIGRVDVAFHTAFPHCA